MFSPLYCIHQCAEGALLPKLADALPCMRLNLIATTSWHSTSASAWSQCAWLCLVRKLWLTAAVYDTALLLFLSYCIYCKLYWKWVADSFPFVTCKLKIQGNRSSKQSHKFSFMSSEVVESTVSQLVGHTTFPQTNQSYCWDYPRQTSDSEGQSSSEE